MKYELCVPWAFCMPWEVTWNPVICLLFTTKILKFHDLYINLNQLSLDDTVFSPGKTAMCICPIVSAYSRIRGLPAHCTDGKADLGMLGI